MAASSIHCIFTGSRGHLDEVRKIVKKVFKLRTFLKKKKPFSNSRSIGGSNPCILRVNPECVERIHRAYAVAMALPEIDGDPGGDWGTYFARRGPWGAHFARSGNNNKTTQGSTGGLTRRGAHGPANYNNIHFIYVLTRCRRAIGEDLSE